MIEETEAKAELIKKIMAALYQAENAGVEDPGGVILEAIEAKKKLDIFLNTQRI